MLIIAYIIITQWSLLVNSSHFYGGTVTWKPMNNTATGSTVPVMFTQSYQWRRSYSGAGCNQTTIVNQSPLIPNTNNAYLSCTTSSCGGYTAISINEYCTDFSALVDSSSGTISTVENIAAGSSFCVAYKGSAWITLYSTDSCGSSGRRKRKRHSHSGPTTTPPPGCYTSTAGWSIGTCIDLTIRSDGFINTPPVATVISPIKVPVNSLTTIDIPVIDADNDYLECRWAENTTDLDECGDVCNAAPGGDLDGDNCTLTFNSTGTNVGDYFAVTLMVEDYYNSTTDTPYSRVPIQFLIYIANATTTCSSQPIISSNLPECSPIQVGTQFNFSLTIDQGCPGTTITDVYTMPPQNLYKVSFAQNGTNYVWILTETWKPTSLQLGPQVYCATATDSKNIQSDQYCLTFTVVPAGSDSLCPGVTTTVSTTTTSTTTTTRTTSSSTRTTSTTSRTTTSTSSTTSSATSTSSTTETTSTTTSTVSTTSIITTATTTTSTTTSTSTSTSTSSSTTITTTSSTSTSTSSITTTTTSSSTSTSTTSTTTTTTSSSTSTSTTSTTTTTTSSSTSTSTTSTTTTTTSTSTSTTTTTTTTSTSTSTSTSSTTTSSSSTSTSTTSVTTTTVILVHKVPATTAKTTNQTNLLLIIGLSLLGLLALLTLCCCCYWRFCTIAARRDRRKSYDEKGTSKYLPFDKNLPSNHNLSPSKYYELNTIRQTSISTIDDHILHRNRTVTMNSIEYHTDQHLDPRKKIIDGTKSRTRKRSNDLNVVVPIDEENKPFSGRERTNTNTTNPETKRKLRRNTIGSASSIRSVRVIKVPRIHSSSRQDRDESLSASSNTATTTTTATKTDNRSNESKLKHSRNITVTKINRLDLPLETAKTLNNEPANFPSSSARPNKVLKSSHPPPHKTDDLFPKFDSSESMNVGKTKRLPTTTPDVMVTKLKRSDLSSDTNHNLNAISNRPPITTTIPQNESSSTLQRDITHPKTSSATVTVSKVSRKKSSM